MRVYPEQLLSKISKEVPYSIMIFGDEALLSLEASDIVISEAKKQGYLEKFDFDLDGKFEKDEIFNHFSSLSLFSEKKIIALSLSKTNKDNTAFIREITALLNPDTLLILKGPKLTQQQMGNVWFKNLNKVGLFIATNLPPNDKFPQWISDRLSAVKLHASQEVINFLSLHFEGNLLAAKQEIEKLSVLYPNQALTLQNVEQNITTHNHFSLFQWIDSLLEGKRHRATRILTQLKAEDTELILISATLNSEVQKLLKLSYQRQQMPLNQLLRQHQPKLWESKQQLYRDFLGRVSTQALEHILLKCADLEVQLKVEFGNNNWLKLQAITPLFL
ncbi:MAG TPA: DNA polymerase III subunit delta [Psychromonas hadalis]|nr:DNA polymerase III subunit delta [Psychromonas hadalis]